MSVSKYAARRVRFRLWASMLSTYGYAVIGAAVIQPLATNIATPTFLQIALFAAGLAFHAFALYIAPQGE